MIAVRSSVFRCFEIFREVFPPTPTCPFLAGGETMPLIWSQRSKECSRLCNSEELLKSGNAWALSLLAVGLGQSILWGGDAEEGRSVFGPREGDLRRGGGGSARESLRKLSGCVKGPLNYPGERRPELCCYFFIMHRNARCLSAELAAKWADIIETPGALPGQRNN